MRVRRKPDAQRASDLRDPPNDATPKQADSAYLVALKTHDYATVEVVDVAVEFDIRWRLLHDDGSIPDGRNPWGYLLMRRGADQPWRIFSEGTG
ncbi:hypothetical protein [Nocardioides ultimimeridianus]